MAQLLMNGLFIILFGIIALLSILDILTTHYVISNSIGYESNEMISNFLDNANFYYFKFFLTILIVCLIALYYGDKNKIEVYLGLIALTIFYFIVVLNNLLVIFFNTDFDFNFSKLLLVFVIIYCAIQVLSLFISKMSGDQRLMKFKKRTGF